MALPIPEFYDPAQVAGVYLERAALVADAAAAYQQQHRIPPATHDTYKIAAFGIDCQVGFCTPGASLFVPGAVEDMQRTLVWLYRNLDRLTGLLFSSTHIGCCRSFIRRGGGIATASTPAPFTPITYEDVRNGTWTPVAHRQECLEYCQKLEVSGKYVLTIWPYHVLLGGMSHTLVPALMEATIFHSLVRQQQAHFEIRGCTLCRKTTLSYHLKCRNCGGKTIGGFNAALFSMLLEYDRVYVFGQAKLSLCAVHAV